MRMRAGVGSTPRLCEVRIEQGDGARIVIDRHAHRLGNRIGGDVVVGGTDAAGGDDDRCSAPAVR